MPLGEPVEATSGRRRDRTADERALRAADEPTLKAETGAIVINAKSTTARVRKARCGLDVKERELLLRGGGAQAPARVVVEAFAVRRDFATPPAAFGAGMQAQK